MLKGLDLHLNKEAAKSKAEKLAKKNQEDAQGKENKNNEEAIEKKNRLLEQRLQHVKPLLSYGETTDDPMMARAPHVAEQESGFGKMAHLNSLNAEGVAAYIAALMFIYGVRFIICAKYLENRQAYNLAKKHSEMMGDNGILYVEDKYGDYPKIYPLDAKGKVDYSAEPLDPSYITRTLIEQNGYMPLPSLVFSMQEEYAEYYAEMFGNPNAASNRHSDLASDNLVANPARPAPKLPGK